MNTQQTEIKHPNVLLGLEVDSPMQRAAGAATSPYHKMKCYNLMTKEFNGWLGVGNNQYVDLVHDAKDAANLAWYSHNSDSYLKKDTTPSDRYLGVGANDYACYGLWIPTGWVNAVIYNGDHTISLKEDPKRKLYKYGNDWVCWSKGEDNQNILRFEFDS